MTHDVFISYEKSDLAVVKSLCHALEAGGVSVWYAPRNILPGADWPDSVARAIDKCRLVVFVYSNHANESEYIRKEITYATSARKTIVPFCLSPMSECSGLRLFLSNAHWLDAYPPPMAAHYAKLLRTTQNYIKLSTRPRPKELQPFPGEDPPSAPRSGALSDRWKITAIFAALAVVVMGAATSLFGRNETASVTTIAIPQSQITARNDLSADCAASDSTWTAFDNNGLPGMDNIDGLPEVLCMNRLRIQNKIVRLAGVGPERTHAAKQLANWIALTGPTVHCQPVFYGAQNYRCDVGSERKDVAQYVLERNWAWRQD